MLRPPCDTLHLSGLHVHILLADQIEHVVSITPQGSGLCWANLALLLLLLLLLSRFSRVRLCATP